MAMLKDRNQYGYEISEYLSQHIDIAAGTVYPILRKLKNEGLLSTYLQEESDGPPRKYYSLTDLGLKHFLAERAEYLRFSHAVDELLEDSDNDRG